jgi:hypothetical protein
MKRLISRVGRALQPVGSVDGFAGGRVVGWAAGQGNVTVEGWIDGKRVVRSTPNSRRHDVAAAYPKLRTALTSGFSLDLPTDALNPNDISELRIVARPSSPLRPAATIATLQIAGAALQDSLCEAEASDLVSPFPRAATDVVVARWPEDCADLVSVAGQRTFVRRIKQLLATPGLNSLPALADYARYLTVTLAHCRFVEKHFPVANAQASAGAADFHCKPNSVRELFPIIHQLYVLRSRGVEGEFAEFGCFKGYSSSMLSFACQQLGITMHVFDSFEGLPPSDGSGYEAGQYAGSLDEVCENVTRFGAAGSVQFHKGFFADTFRNWRPPALMCLWMDVDLEVSSRDLMVVADRLDPRGTLFSHECPAAIFQNGQIVSPPSPGNPIAPVLTRFHDLGRPLTGRYVSGFTGAFWPREGGIPLVDTDVLFELVSTSAG